MIAWNPARNRFMSPGRHSRTAAPLKSLSFLTMLVAGIAFPPASARAQWIANGVALSGAANTQQLPASIPDGAGGAIVAWQDYRSGGSDIYVRRVDDSGAPQWTVNGVAVCTSANDQWEPKLVSDGAGGAIVTWYDERGGTNNDDIYIQRVDAAGVPQWTANGVVVSATTSEQVVPAIVSDGAGGAIVAWHDSRNGADDIYVQRVNSSGVPQWTANGVVLCNAANNQAFVGIARDNAGGAIVTWQDGRAGNDDIYAQRVDASGVPLWAANGHVVCAASSGQQSPVIVSDGTGGAIVSWRDGRPGAKGIYAQRMSLVGTAQWTADGVALCTAGTFQLFPAITTNGANGAIVTWQDNRSGSSYDVYAQRVSSLGVPFWTVNGVALGVAANDQSLPVIATDGEGGAIVTWWDGRSGTIVEVYAQRVISSGTTAWTANGVALTTGVESYSPVIVTDEEEGAIIAWVDSRTDAGDIYALRLDATGQIPTSPVAAPTVTTSPLVEGLFPNPTTGPATLNLATAAPSPVQFEVFDVAGRSLRAMTMEGAVGVRQIQFDGRDDRGRPLPSGVYFYRVTTEGETVTRKMVIAR